MSVNYNTCNNLSEENLLRFILEIFINANSIGSDLGLSNLCVVLGLTE